MKHATRFLQFLVVVFVCVASTARAQFLAFETDRFGYVGTATRHNTLADAQSGASQVGPTIDLPSRPFSLFITRNRPVIDPLWPYATTSWISTAYWFTVDENTNGLPKDHPEGDRLYNGLYRGEYNNFGVGAFEAVDERSMNTSFSMGFAGYNGSVWTEFDLSLSGANLNDANRWAANFAFIDDIPRPGVFVSYELEVTASGLNGIEASPGQLESAGHPLGVAGTFTGIFEDRSSDPLYKGFYAFRLTLNMQNQLYDAGDEALNGNWGPSFFSAPHPKSPVPNLVGLLQEQAIAATEAARFVPTVEYQPSAVIPLDQVLGQEPVAGTIAFEGTTVNLVVSRGVTVPSVVGLAEDAATTTLISAGLIVTRTMQASLTVPMGRVISQNPAAGAQVSGGTPTNLVVSAGTTVPEVVGQTQSAATTAIQNAGLLAAIATQPSSTVPLGSVISQSPIGGTSLSAGATVTLMVSGGIIVPNVVGQTQSNATASLTNAGLNVTTTAQMSATVPAGSVISQNPVSGATVSSGSSVAVVISSGVVTSPTLATATVGENFSYQITASNAPTSFGASGLPANLAVDSVTGIISGIPAAAGSHAVTVSASNDSGTASAILNLTINPAAPPNTAPTISAIANQVTAANTSVGPLGFTVGDVETPASSLTVTGSSSNLVLVPNANITIGGGGANRTVTVTPSAGQSGTAIITRTVSDGTLTTASAFTLTVNNIAGNGPVAAYNFDQGAGTSLTDFSGNANTGAITGATWTTAGKYGGALTFNGTSDLVLVDSSPSLNFTTAMTIEAWVYPTGNQSGWRTIVQRQVDAYFLHASSNSALRPAAGGTFNGSVAFVASSAALPLSTWSHLAVTYDQANVRLYVNGVQVASQTRTGTIQSTSLPLRIGGNVPYGEFFLGRIDDVRVYNRALGVTEIQGDMNTPVAIPSSPPTISVFANQTTAAGTPVGPIAFTVGDVDSPSTSLVLTGTSSNPGLVPNANISFEGSGASRTVTITPISGQSGSATLSIAVSDGFSSATSTFTLTVNPPAPTITSATVATATVGVDFSYGITATHTPTSFGASGLPANLAVNSVTGVISGIAAAAGSHAVTVTASNVSGTGSVILNLTINPPAPSNTAPTISAVANQTTGVNAPVGPLAFTVGDTETAAGSLTVTGTSSNQALVPSTNVTFGGSGANRTVTVTPSAGQSGTAIITRTVSDGTLTTASAFTLTVNPVAGNGPVAAYNFDQGSGTSLTDSSGHANTGAITGATWTTAGKYGGALTFNGTSNLVVVNSSPSLNFTTAMTIEAWVYPTASQSGWRTIVQRQVDAYFLHASSNSALRPAAGGTFNGSVAFVASSAALPLNTWTHLAVTYDQANIRLYVNGAQVASQARTGTIQSTSSPLRIGGNVPYGEFFLGRIDDVRVYNRALGVTEIQSDMNTPIP